MTGAESAGSGQTRLKGEREPMAAHALRMMISTLASLLSRSRTTALRAAFRKLAVTTLAVGLALAPLPLASAHDPLALAAAESAWHAALLAQESARHAALLAQEIAEHGHSHDDGEAHEQSGGHMHGHDPADHSHQFAFVAGSASQWGLPAPERWPSSRSGPPDPATGSGIDRPPKQAMSL